MGEVSQITRSAPPARAGSSGYLDTATYGLPPETALDALQTCLDEWRRGAGRWVEWEAIGGECRSLFAGLLRCDPTTVALMPSVSQASAVVVSAVPDGGEVVLAEGDFASVVLPVLVAARSRGLVVRRAPVSELAAAIRPGTDLVAVSHVQSATGELADLAAIATAATRVGARVYVDATQGLGVVPLDAPALGISFVACAAYKWLCCPRGVAFLHVSEDVSTMPPPAAASWRGAVSPYDSFYPEALDLSATASRFDLPLAWHLWVSARSSLAELVGVGDETRYARAMGVATRIAERLGQPRPESAIVAVGVSDPAAALAALTNAGIKASVRNSSVRLSPHYYNDLTDADRAVQVLSALVP